MPLGLFIYMLYEYSLKTRRIRASTTEEVYKSVKIQHKKMRG